MKTYVLKLEPHDDITSVKDKMGWGKSSRILIVWPENEQVLDRRLDLVLLKRHAAVLGAQIALVVKNARMRLQALHLGIPVFSNLSRAQSTVWRLPRRFRHTEASLSQAVTQEKSKRKHNSFERLESIRMHRPERLHPLHPLLRFGLFSTSVLSVFLLAALLLPSAEIQLSPKVEEQVLTFAVRANPAHPNIEVSGELPAKKISVVVEGRDTLPASSSEIYPDQPSNGRVLITNLTDQVVEIPSGTVVRSLGEAGLRFGIVSSASLPPGPDQVMSLPVRCLEPGSAGNLPAGSIVAVEGMLGTQISVTNPLPTRGGSDRKLPVPSDTDRKELASRIKESLKAAALLELESSLEPGDLFIPTSLRLVEVVDQQYQPAQGLPTSELELILRARYDAFFVAHRDVQTLVERVFSLNIPEGYKPAGGASHFSTLGDVNFLGNTAEWRLQARRLIQAEINPAQAVNLSLGQESFAAKRRLTSSLPVSEAPVIRLFPPWWPRLPFIPLRIQVQVSDTTATIPGSQ